MSKRITQEELESYLWGSAVLLRNHIDAGAYKQYIFPLLFFKRLNDVYEEETAKATRENGPEAADWEETHSFVLPDGAHPRMSARQSRMRSGLSKKRIQKSSMAFLEMAPGPIKDAFRTAF